MRNHLQKSYEEAVLVLKENSASFYKAFKNLPEEKFQGVASLYAYCRTCDDIVDEQRDPHIAEAELSDLEKNVRDLYKDGSASPPFPWWGAFEDTVGKFHVDPEPFLMQMQGQRMDLRQVEMQDTEDLLEYSRLVAGSVGLMLAKVLARDEEVAADPKFLQACMDLGIGMQITNILRDIGEDLRERNRVYLPKSLMEEFGITKDDLYRFIEIPAKNITPNFIRLWEELAALAEKYYAGLKDMLCDMAPEARVSVYSSTTIYKEILEEVRKNNYNCFTKRNYTNKVTRLRLVIAAEKAVREVCYES